MSTETDIARLRIEVTDQVKPNLLAAALRNRLAGRGWVAGAENDVAAAVVDAAATHLKSSGSTS